MMNRYRQDGATTYILLDDGQEAICDTADLALMFPYEWTSQTRDGRTYALGSMLLPNGEVSTVYMHDLVMRNRP